MPIPSIQYDHPTDAMLFKTNGNNEKLRIDSSGNLTLQGGKIYGEDNAANSLHLQNKWQ